MKCGTRWNKILSIRNNDLIKLADKTTKQKGNKIIEEIQTTAIRLLQAFK